MDHHRQLNVFLFLMPLFLSKK